MDESLYLDRYKCPGEARTGTQMGTCEEGEAGC